MNFFANPIVSLFYLYKKLPNNFSEWLYHFTLPSAMDEGSVAPYTHLHLVLSGFFTAYFVVVRTLNVKSTLRKILGVQ